MLITLITLIDLIDLIETNEDPLSMMAVRLQNASSGRMQWY